MIVKQCVLAVALFMQIYNVASQEIPSLPTIFSDKFKFGFGGLDLSGFIGPFSFRNEGSGC